MARVSESVRQKDERKKTTVEGEKRKEGGREPEDGPKQIFKLGLCVLVCHLNLFLEGVFRAKLGSVFVCAQVCETLTALQGLFAPRQHSAG